jgi:putative tricarboxylic transport membrane protein
MKKKDLIPAFIWMGLGIAVAAISYGLQLGTLRNPGAGLMPFLLGILLSLCSVPILIDSLLTIRNKAKQGDESIWSGVEFKRLILVIISLICYAMILEKVGFVIATFLLLIILFKVIGSRKWLFTLMASATVVFLSYLLFVTLLKVEMPWGIWGIG